MLNICDYYSQVTCVGQVIGAVIAESKNIALKAAKAVKVEYEDLPPIITIEVLTKNNERYKTALMLRKKCMIIALNFLSNLSNWKLKKREKENRPSTGFEPVLPQRNRCNTLPTEL